MYAKEDVGIYLPVLAASAAHAKQRLHSGLSSYKAVLTLLCRIHRCVLDADLSYAASKSSLGS